MNQSLKTIGVAAFLILSGVLAGRLSAPKADDSYNKELERQNAELAERVLSLENAYETASFELAVAVQEVDAARDSLTIESQKSEFYKIRYEKVKRTPVVIADQRQLDSLLMARYPFLRHPKAR